MVDARALIEGLVILGEQTQAAPLYRYWSGSALGDLPIHANDRGSLGGSGTSRFFIEARAVVGRSRQLQELRAYCGTRLADFRPV